MTLEEIIDGLYAEIESFFTAAEAREDKACTEEELVKIGTLNSKIEGLETQLATQKKLAAHKALVLAPAGAPRSTEAGIVDPDAGSLEDGEGDKYADVYKGDLASFALDVRQAAPKAETGSVSERLQKYLNLYSTEAGKIAAAAPTQVHEVVGTDEGGFMVPPDYRDLLWEVIMSEEGLFGQSNPEPTIKNMVAFAADESTAWSADGIQANWLAEAGQMSASKLATQGRLTRLEKIYAFVNVTDEILSDAPRLNNRLTRRAPEAIRFKIDEAMVNGNGTGKPLGWMNSPALITVAKEGGQAADTIVAENIANMYMRIFPESITAGARWLVNQDIFQQLTELEIGGRIVYSSPVTGIVNAPAGTLFGIPIMFSQHAKTLGDLGDIQLIDIAQGYYSTNKAGGIKFATSIHLFFDYDVNSFRWTFRVGGRPYLSAPIDPQFGSNSNSHFVALAARA